MAAQAALVLVCLLAHLFHGEAISFSVLVGAGIGAMGVGYAAWRVFWRPTERALSGTSELATLYRAEVGKLAIIGGLCAVVFFADRCADGKRLGDRLAVEHGGIQLVRDPGKDATGVDNGIRPKKKCRVTRLLQRVISTTICKT